MQCEPNQRTSTQPPLEDSAAQKLPRRKSRPLAATDFSEADRKRFWSKVNKKNPSDCWEWTAGKFQNGYGSFRFKGCSHGSHRVSFTLNCGNPNDVLILHKCDNRLCVNPSHLFSGTHCDNMADMKTKGRSASGAKNGALIHSHLLARGSRHGRNTKPERTARGERIAISKLKSYQVIELRRLHSEGCSFEHLGRLFAVSGVNARAVAIRETWKHL